MQGKCKLCGTTTDLRDSHIIPELCYRPAYDAIHRATKFQAEPDNKRLIQQGIRQRLLCDLCEKKFNVWETAFAKLWYLGKALGQPILGQPLFVKGFDYRTFKLFHLSIFWRASVAGGLDFNTVDLGEHEEVIRKLLEAEDPGPQDHYPMFGQVLLHKDGSVAFGVVGKPQRSEWVGQPAYYAIYGGVEWCLIVTRDSSPADIQQLLPYTMKTSGEMALGTLPLEGSSSFKTFASQYQSGDK